MRNWRYAAGRLFPTVRGFVRCIVRSPRIARQVFSASLHYALTGRMSSAVVVEKGYRIEDPKELVGYLAHFVEEEVEAREWLIPFRRAQAPVCLDVGGHAGIFSLKLLCENPAALVYAFEPQPDLARKASQALASESSRYRCFPLAVSDAPGKTRLYRDSIDNSQASLERSWRPEAEEVLEVETVTLDAAAADLGNIFLLKIDVEGHEARVLAGGKGTLKRTRFVLVEILSEESLRRCRSILGPGWKEKKIGRGDYLFEAKTTVVSSLPAESNSHVGM